MPEQLDDEELADWRAGRNAVYQLAALTIGARLADADAWGAAPAGFRFRPYPLLAARRQGLGWIAERLVFSVDTYDPYLPNGVELALGIDRAASLEELLRRTDTLSIHTP
jgi:hypothetical protein